MKQNDVLEIFENSGALLHGHFVLSSGLHSSVYLQCAIALRSPQTAARFGSAIADHFRSMEIEAVASPAIGGLVIGYEVARHLDVPFIWTERENGVMTLRRGFSVAKGERILVVEDVITTGGSTRETINVLEDGGANVVGAASIIDRSDGQADVGVQRFSLATLNVPSVPPSDCEPCKRGEMAVKPGSRTTTRR